MLDDRELMKRIEQQDHHALALLYDQYARVIYSLCFRILNNRTLAEEATQDTFMKIWQRAALWDPDKGQLLSWMLTVARFAAIDRLRVEQRQTANSTALDDVPPIESRTGIPDDPRYRLGRTFKELLSQLPKEQAHVIELAFFNGMTHQDLAKHLNLPLGTVKTRVRLGIQKLRSLWKETSDSTIIENE